MKRTKNICTQRLSENCTQNKENQTGEIDEETEDQGLERDHWFHTETIFVLCVIVLLTYRTFQDVYKRQTQNDSHVDLQTFKSNLANLEKIVYLLPEQLCFITVYTFVFN